MQSAAVSWRDFSVEAPDTKGQPLVLSVLGPAHEGQDRATTILL